MTLCAHRVALLAEARAVRIVAVRAGHARAVHRALEERAVLVDLVADLAVGVVARALEEAHAIRLLQRLTRQEVAPDRSAARVTSTTRFHLGARRQRHGAPGDGLTRCERPAVAGRVLEGDDEPAQGIGARDALARPRDVAGAGAVTGLARHVHVRPRGVEAVLGQPVVLLEVRRVAVGAHVVPVLQEPGPVEDIAVVDLLSRVQVEPALPAGRRRAAVPRDAEGLIAPAGKLDQVLLQRLDPEGVGDPVVAQGAVWTVRPHEVLPVAREEGRGHAVLGEARVAEVPQNGLAVGRLHGQGVVGDLPQLVLLAMAPRARLAADVGGGRRRRHRGRWPGRGAPPHRREARGQTQRHDADHPQHCRPPPATGGGRRGGLVRACVADGCVSPQDLGSRRWTAAYLTSIVASASGDGWTCSMRPLKGHGDGSRPTPWRRCPCRRRTAQRGRSPRRRG